MLWKYNTITIHMHTHNAVYPVAVALQVPKLSPSLEGAPYDWQRIQEEVLRLL